MELTAVVNFLISLQLAKVRHRHYFSDIGSDDITLCLVFKLSSVLWQCWLLPMDFLFINYRISVENNDQVHLKWKYVPVWAVKQKTSVDTNTAYVKHWNFIFHTWYWLILWNPNWVGNSWETPSSCFLIYFIAYMSWKLTC